MSYRSQALVEYQRAGLTEATKYGALAWVSGKGLFHQAGDDVLCYGRSTAKPLHMKVFAQELAPVLPWAQKALSVASHNAEPFQLKAIKEILASAKHKHVKTPATMPLRLDPKIHKSPNRWYHPCSGEHSAILRGCALKSWNLESYRSLQHPFHQTFLKYVQSVLGATWQAQYTARDGCGLATVSLTLSELALLFANLVREKDQDWIWEAMANYPQYVGGRNRLDTTIMQSCEGKVLAKEGADGLLGLAIQHPDHPQGLGVMIKLAHGTDNQAMWYIARGILGSLGWSLPLPAALFRQNPKLASEIVPPFLRERLAKLAMRDLSHELDDIFKE